MKDVKIKVTFSIEKAKRQIEPTEQELFAKQLNPVFIEKKDKNLQSMVIEMKYNGKS